MKNSLKLPHTKISRGLRKRVKCPKCGRYGSLIARSRGKNWYYYVHHRVGKEVIEHYVGSAKKYVQKLVEGLGDFVRRILISEMEVKAVVKSREAELSMQVSFEIIPEIKDKIDDIGVLRQTMVDLCTFLIAIKKNIESEIEKIESKYGIEHEEVTKRYKELFVNLILYYKVK